VPLLLALAYTALLLLLSVTAHQLYLAALALLTVASLTSAWPPLLEPAAAIIAYIYEQVRIVL
jgi:hypothetical protein